MQPYTICTDTGADLPLFTPLAQKVGFAQIYCALDDAVFTYQPGLDSDFSAFFSAMRSAGAGSNAAEATTSPATSQTYLALWEPHLIAGRNVLHLSISRYLSDSFFAAAEARASLLQRYPARRIVLVDTLCSSVAQGMLVREAAIMQKDDATIDEVANWVLDNRSHINGLLLPDNLLWARASGVFRGGMLGMKQGRRLLLEMDAGGNLRQICRCKDEHDAFSAILERMRQVGLALEHQTILITHADAPDLAARLRDFLITELGCDDASIVPMGPVPGCHAGPDAIGIAFYGRNRDE